MIRGTMPIVMAVWQRLDRLPRTLELLQAQDDEDWSLHLWLNQSSGLRLKQVLEATEKEPRVVTVNHTTQNLGPFARFRCVRKVWPVIADEPAVVFFLDDDVEPRPHYLSYLRGAADDFAIYSKTVWHFNEKPKFNLEGECTDPGGSYWNRHEASIEHDDGDYAGTAWMACPRELMYEDLLFDSAARRAAPGRFEMIGADLWLSYVAEQAGFPLRPLPKLPASIVDDGKDTWAKEGMRARKTELLHFLRRVRGWRR